MNIPIHERPGVYSCYDASSVFSQAKGGKTVGIIGENDIATPGKLYRISSHEEAAQAFGSDSSLTSLISLLFQNGAGAVYAIPVKTDDDYGQAFLLLNQVEEITVLLCDSTSTPVQQAARDAVKAASSTRKERIAVLPASNENAARLIQQAAEINSERVILVTAGKDHTLKAAAALAGAIAYMNDPAIPLGGTVLFGIQGTQTQFSDSEIDAFIRGGITPIETSAGQVSVVRAVTTRTKTADAPDPTWRELSTILIIDEVIPAIRNRLRTKFNRAKNTAQSRGAVRAQVILLLEDFISREIIEAYQNVSVSPSELDPTICLVDFSFAVAHGMNQIWLNAHISV